MMKNKVDLKKVLFYFVSLLLILCSANSFASKKAMPWITLLLFPESDYGVFSSACSPGFDGIDEAAPFDEKIGIHPIVLLSDGQKHMWNDSLPPTWVPNSISETEFVACIGKEFSKLIQTCEYSPTGRPPYTAWYYRYRYYIETTLLEAKTGSIINNGLTIYGSSPPSCPQYIPHTQSVYGDHVSSVDFSNVLSDYVNGYIVRSFVAPDDDIRDLAFDGTHLWLNDYFSSKLYKLDPTIGEVVSSFDFLHPNAVASNSTYLWVNDSSNIYKLDPNTAEIISSFPVYPRSYSGLEYDGTYLWGTELYGDIHKLDPSTGEIVSSFEAPANWPEDLAFDGTYLWHADGLSNIIYKLDPVTGAVLGSFDAPEIWRPIGLAFDEPYLWVVTSHPSGNDIIYKVNPR